MVTLNIGNLRRGFFLAVFTILLPAGAAPGECAESVAMVTDLQGKIAVQSGTRKGELTVLAEIDSGTRVQLGDGARLVAIYLKAGDEYTMSGPAVIGFNAEQPVAVSG